jgi:hypothetical protein
MNGQEQFNGQNHTLLPLLILAVNQTTGPVLEIGTGDASTPILHSLLRDTGRGLFSFDDNPDWVDRYDSLRARWHRIVLVDYADKYGPKALESWIDCRWGAVLLDHAPYHCRVREAIRLKDIAEQIVIHDINAEDGHAADPVWEHFKYRVDDKRFLPWTTCVSNVRPLEFP